jgi:hypothetical protein
LAEVAYRADPCAGVTFIDPFDRIPIRWNPIGYDDEVVQSGGKFVIDTPGQWVSRVGGGDVWVNSVPNENGDYPIDPRALGRKLAPFIVHTLDAFFSSLVIKGLAARGVRDFVAIHDAWLVPATVNGQPGLDVLGKVIKEASLVWFKGLGPIYDGLDRYLRDDTDRKGRPSKHWAFVQLIRARWKDRKRRVAAGTDTPPCFVAAPH